MAENKESNQKPALPAIRCSELLDRLTASEAIVVIKISDAFRSGLVSAQDVAYRLKSLLPEPIDLGTNCIPSDCSQDLSDQDCP
jgi:hypothetical protein